MALCSQKCMASIIVYKKLKISPTVIDLLGKLLGILLCAANSQDAASGSIQDETKSGRDEEEQYKSSKQGIPYRKWILLQWDVQFTAECSPVIALLHK